jgi:hypothetical protein
LLGNSKIAGARPDAVSSYHCFHFGKITATKACDRAAAISSNPILHSADETRAGGSWLLSRARRGATWSKTVMLLQKAC